MKTTFGERLSELRKAKAVTQQALADKAGVPLTTLRHHEYDKRMMSAADLFSYSKALGVKCSAFDNCVPGKTVRKPNPTARMNDKKDKAVKG